MSKFKKVILTVVMALVIGGVIGFSSHFLFADAGRPYSSMLTAVIIAAIFSKIWGDKSDKKPLKDVLASYGERVSAPKNRGVKNKDGEPFDEHEERIRISKLYDESLKNKSD